MLINFIQWSKKSLFSNWWNSLITLFCIYLLFLTIPPFINWAILDATFSGKLKTDCMAGGACWVFIRVWFEKLMYGFYPVEHIWRINLSFIIFIGTIGLSFFVREKYKLYILFFLIFIFPVIAFILIRGGFGLTIVETREWGGLALTFILAIFGIILSFPLGVLLAMGRRSELPVIKYFCICFIETWRGIPLITVLFAAAVMFPLLLPSGTLVDKLLRVAIGIAIFESAYVAEVVRGGLQSLPRGQYDAAKSIGMGYWQMNFFIVLPQAIKTVIPGITNTFIALLKDTPLIYLIGMAEILGIVNMAKANPYWLGMAVEGYVFAAIIFGVVSFFLSSYSQKLEKKFSTENK